MKLCCNPGEACLYKKNECNEKMPACKSHECMSVMIAIIFMYIETGPCNCLRWLGSQAQRDALERWLKETDWFIMPYSLKEFFDNFSGTVVLHINPKKLCYVALLLRILKDEMLIESALGKGYLEVAARQTDYYHKQPKAKRFSRLSTEIMNDSLNNSHILMPVLHIIGKVKEIA
jgi:hypothetical protein